MDIQVSSNFERYLFEAGERDAGAVRRMMASLRQSGRFDLGPVAADLRAEFAAASASEGEVGDAIRRTLATTGGYLIDPHTACGVVALDKTSAADPAVPQIVLATAHPAKFPSALEAMAGVRPELPPRLQNLLTDPERITQMPNDVTTLESYVERHSRAAGVIGGKTA
jgi:threonine synthase